MAKEKNVPQEASFGTLCAFEEGRKPHETHIPLRRSSFSGTTLRTKYSLPEDQMCTYKLKEEWKKYIEPVLQVINQNLSFK